MVTGQSALLNKPVPTGLAVRLKGEGIDPARAWLSTDTDLNLSGNYEQVFLLAYEDRLVTAAVPSNGQVKAVRINLNRADIKEVRTRQGVGGGFLEALVEGVYVEVLAFSNARADTFHKVRKKLKDWCKGQAAHVGPEDDINPRKCPKCGMTLQFKGDVCRRCVDHGAVFARVLKLMKPYRNKAIVMMGLVLVGIGLTLIPPKLVQVLIDRVLAPEQAHNAKPDNPGWWLLCLVAALFGTHFIGAAVHTIIGRLASFVGTQITYDMRERVFNHLTGLGIDYYDRYNVGQLMSRVAGDTEQFKGFVHQLTTGFFQQLIMVVAVGAVLFTLSWKLALFTLLPAPLVILAAVFFWRRIYPRYYRVWDANSKLHSALNTILSGIRVVKAFGQEQREQGRFGRSSGYVRDSFRGVEYTVSMFNPSIGLIFQMGGLIVWFVGGKEVLAGVLSLGILMQFLNYLWMFYGPLGNLTQLTNWLTQFLTASQRTFEILDTPSQISQVKNAKSLPACRGHIVFENVTFGYHRHEPIIKNVSFEIRPGEHVGIVGKSGSGKTTLVNLLGRFYDVDEGRITIDGVDVRDLNLDDLRKSIGIVLQEPFLFRGTIYNNITYGRRDTTAEKVLEVAKAANAHHFIIRHPLGYDTYIGERGAGLSGGERQRVSIARALLYDPRILILDEATSNVDTESEQLIQEALGRVTAGRTTIAIAHRLSTLKASDRIFVVDSGQIVENGSHEELLAKKGLYHRLVKIQTELSREPSIDALAVRK
ncbi:MAG: ABC transporter ATP-binding protein [Phycisphaerae bacterium]